MSNKHFYLHQSPRLLVIISLNVYCITVLGPGYSVQLIHCCPGHGDQTAVMIAVFVVVGVGVLSGEKDVELTQIFLITIFLSSHMHPENPEGSRV